MSVYLFTKLFYLLVLLLLMGGTLLCGQVCADDTQAAASKNPVDVFKKEQTITEVLKPDPGVQKIQTVKEQEFYSPAFVSAGDVLVALAGIYRTTPDKKNITVLTKYFDTNGKADWTGEMFKTSATEWKAQFAVYDDCGSDSCKGTSALKGFVAAAKDSKIYLLLVNATSGSNGALTLEFRLAEGTVSTGTSNKITWSIKTQLTPSENKEFSDNLEAKKLSNGALFGSAIVTNEKQIIFLLKVQKDDKKSFAIAFINLDSVGTAKEITFLSSNEIAKECYPYLGLWKNKIIVIPTNCEDASNKKVNEITDVTKPSNWIKTSEEFSHFVSFFHDKSDFTTASIKNEVLLFTQKKPKQPPPSDDQHDVYLWVTDGKHVYNVGKFLDNVNVTSINLLYTKEELLVIYQQWEQREPKTIVLRQLKAQLNDIKTVIDAWKEIPETVKQICGGKILCDAKLSTDGLVGFLRTTMTKDADTIWKDEYYYVNATVTDGATKVTNGFTFSGTGVGAQWPVGKEQNDQPYKFTDPGFTLVATVEIGKNDNEKTFDNSLLGLILKDNKRIGLLCSGGNWAVGDKTRILKKSGEKCEQEETYIVGLVLEKGGNLAIYVDGKKLNDLDNQELKIGEGKTIKHFYFGADAEGTGDTQKLAKTDVTITNVLLYNLPIDEEKIKNIKAQKREKPKLPTPLLNGTISTQEVGKNTSETGRPSSTSATEKDGAEIKLCLPLKNDFTLFALLLLVGFTLLARYA